MGNMSAGAAAAAAAVAVAPAAPAAAAAAAGVGPPLPRIRPSEREAISSMFRKGEKTLNIMRCFSAGLWDVNYPAGVIAGKDIAERSM